MYKENFAERIRDVRTEAGFTQQYVADEIKIPRTKITKYENGQLEPTLEILGKLAQFYNVDINWLLGVSILPPIRPSKTDKKSS